MSSSVYIPSSSSGGNTPPTSTSIKTASYTIPAGKYAKIYPHSKWLTVDGVYRGHVLLNYTRTLSATSSTYEVLWYNELTDQNFMRVTLSSTINNAANSAYVTAYRVFTETPATGFALNNFNWVYTSRASFTGAVITNHENFINLHSSRSDANPSASTQASGVALNVNRASGTVSANVIIYRTNTEAFFVPSGTVLDGSSYSVEEYTV